MSKFLLKIKTKSGQHVIDTMRPSNTLKELKECLSPIVKIPVPNIRLLNGFPPKILVTVDESKTLADVNIKSGDTLIVEEGESPLGDPSAGTKIIDQEMIIDEKKEEGPVKDVSPPLPETEFDGDGIEGGLLMRKVVPADNSCLFTSLGFVLGGKVDTTCGSYMRQIIAEEIRGNGDIYSEAILGMTPSKYCEWILKPDSWGGGIEISALSRHYGLEIAVVDTQSGIINRFGEDKHYDYRVFLIFDGIHYDPLYREQVSGGIQTMFLRQDSKVLAQAEELATEAKSSRQFTDVNRFTLRCLVCRQELKGQTEAQAHAKQTGHVSFGEIS